MKRSHHSRRPTGRTQLLALVVLLLATVPLFVLRGGEPGVSTHQSQPGTPLPSPVRPTTGPPGGAAMRPLTVVGLGDSVPAAGTCDCTGYVEQVGAQLQSLTRGPWVVVNDATGGWTTSDVQDHLRDTTIRAHLAAADLVILQVGANDFTLDQVSDPGCLPIATSGCFASTLTELHTDLTGVITGIRAINHRPDLRIAVLGYWNVTFDGQVGQGLGTDFVVGSEALTAAVNQTILAVADATGSIYVDAFTPLKGPAGQRDPTPDLLDDGDHPNAMGHTLIAAAVIAALERSGLVGSVSARS